MRAVVKRMNETEFEVDFGGKFNAVIKRDSLKQAKFAHTLRDLINS